jgi:hypothetical protein
MINSRRDTSTMRGPLPGCSREELHGCLRLSSTPSTNGG